MCDLRNDDIVFWAINLPLRLQLLSLMLAAVFALCASQAFSLDPSVVDDHIGGNYQSHH